MSMQVFSGLLWPAKGEGKMSWWSRSKRHNDLERELKAPIWNWRRLSNGMDAMQAKRRQGMQWRGEHLGT